jgi:hypothetical protein
MCPFEKPALSDVHALLRDRNALIVHFSGVPPAGTTMIRYPSDLKEVIAGRASNGVPCSVVIPGDVFTGAGKRNAYGTIGVILDLRTDQSLATATAGDGGSRWDGTGPRQFDERDLNIEDLTRSLSSRRGHNEWGMRDFIVRGVFVIEPIEIWRSIWTRHGHDGAIDRQYSLEQVRADFPQQRLYSFEETHIVELHPRGHKPRVRHDELYRWAL